MFNGKTPNNVRTRMMNPSLASIFSLTKSKTGGQSRNALLSGVPTSLQNNLSGTIRKLTGFLMAVRCVNYDQYHAVEWNHLSTNNVIQTRNFLFKFNPQLELQSVGEIIDMYHEKRSRTHVEGIEDIRLISHPYEGIDIDNIKFSCATWGVKYPNYNAPYPRIVLYGINPGIKVDQKSLDYKAKNLTEYFNYKTNYYLPLDPGDRNSCQKNWLGFYQECLQHSGCQGSLQDPGWLVPQIAKRFCYASSANTQSRIETARIYSSLDFAKSLEKSDLNPKSGDLQNQHFAQNSKSSVTENKMSETTISSSENPGGLCHSTNIIRFIYNSGPIQLADYDTKTGLCKITNIEPKKWKTYFLRGSAGPVQMINFNGYLTVVHEVIDGDPGRIYLHRFIILDFQFKTLKISNVFYIDHLGIEFCSGLTYNKEMNGYYLGIGLEDSQALVYGISEKKVLDLCHNLEIFPVS